MGSNPTPSATALFANIRRRLFYQLKQSVIDDSCSTRYACICANSRRSDGTNDGTDYEDGTQTFCLEFELSCKDNISNPAFINNFDKLFEEGIPDTREGKEKYVRHKTRERNQEIVRQKKEKFRKQYGRLFCEVCHFDFNAIYGAQGDGFIECHHNIPLYETTDERTTKLSDLSLLCSNCHRMVHRKKEWLTVEQLKKIYRQINTKTKSDITIDH